MVPSAVALLQVIGLLCSFFYILFYFSSKKHGGGKWKPLPGPRSLPIIGNLHLLGKLPHQSLYHLAKIHGPMMSIRLGTVPTVVVSSPRVAELFLKTHDSVFASRPKVKVMETLSYGGKGMAFTEHGPYWRGVRKLATLQLFSGTKIESFAPMRKEVLTLFIESLKNDSGAKKVVNVSEKLGELNEEMTLRMILGHVKYDEFNLKEIVEELTSLAGTFNLSWNFQSCRLYTFSGCFRPTGMSLQETEAKTTDENRLIPSFLLHGLGPRTKTGSEALGKALEKIIDDRRDQPQKQERDFVDTLLTVLNQPTNHDDHTIDRDGVKAIISDMIVAGLDTTTVTLEWAIAELIRHPRVLLKLQQELESVVGNKRMVEEIDLPKLQYLDMVVKETFRLHPAGPLLVPRESMEDVVVDGYYIPKESRVLVNVWAIGRDPNAWSNDVEEFMPERFIGCNIDIHGQNFELIPFGAGRRSCPGKKIGLITVKFVLAQLVHCFNWELPSGVSTKELDMTEKLGLSLPRNTNLFAMPIYRM